MSSDNKYEAVPRSGQQSVTSAFSNVIVQSVNTPFIKFLAAFTVNFTAIKGVIYLVKKIK
jgi:hypothetical protein